MSSRYLVDPELSPALDIFPEMNLSWESLPPIRAAILEQIASMPAPIDPDVQVETIVIPGPEGAPPVPLIAYRPTAAQTPLPGFLHLHAGGYIVGTPAMMDAANRQLARDLGCAIFSVDYRLSPETKYPGAIEDCYAALKYLHRNAAALGIDTARIGVKGESAGGGLAAALALLARDRGEFPLAFQHLLYPMLDDRAATAAHPDGFAGEFVWTRDQNHFGWSALLNAEPGGPETPPYAAAARATELSGLPPAFIAAGTLDLLQEQDVNYAMRLTRAGVPVELHVYPGAFHAFDLAPNARVAIAARRDSQEALRRALHG
jgi:acetyl esterase/lipase